MGALKLDTIRRFLREDNYLDTGFAADLENVVTAIENAEDPHKLIAEYPRMRSLLGYWLSDYTAKLAEKQASQERQYGQLYAEFSKKMKTEGDKITEGSVQSRIHADDMYYQARVTLINVEKVKEFIQHMLDAIDKDILVQLSVNSRVNNDVA